MLFLMENNEFDVLKIGNLINPEVSASRKPKILKKLKIPVLVKSPTLAFEVLAISARSRSGF